MCGQYMRALLVSSSNIERLNIGKWIPSYQPPIRAETPPTSKSSLERSQCIVEYYADVNEPSKAQHMKRKQHKKIIKRKCLSSCKNLVLRQSSDAFGKSFPTILGSDDLFPKSISVLQKLHIPCHQLCQHCFHPATISTSQK